MNAKSKILITAGVVAVVLVAFFAIKGFPPVDNTAGTIGGDEIAGVKPAERYRSDQVESGDIMLDSPEFQAPVQRSCRSA